MSNPSDQNFDRSNLTDSEYIEQLIFENRELKAQINKLNKTIDGLKHSSENINLQNGDELSASQKIQRLQKKGSSNSDNDDVVVNDIPMRSARRRRNSSESKDLARKASSSSLQSSILTYDEDKSDLLKHETTAELSTAKIDNEITMESIDTLDSTILNKSNNELFTTSSNSKLNRSTSSLASKIRIKPPHFKGNEPESKASSILPIIPSTINDEGPKTPHMYSAFGMRFDDDKEPTQKPGANGSLDPPYQMPASASNSNITTPRPQFQTPNSSTNNINTISSPQTPGSSFTVLHTPKTEMDETSLFIKPEEFHTIFISVVSTIHINSSNQASKRSDDPNITMTINDRETNKEMWRIRKTYSQLMSFDDDIRPILEYFGLTILPEKQSFISTTPSKIESRRSTLQTYFNSIFLMPHIPHMVLFKICKFLSLDFVNPLDDFQSGARKEGFLVRKYKGLGSTWKIRWCQVDGPYLEIYENPGGLLLEQIRLKRSQIGRQTIDSVAEDKGYRHAFLIMESQKSSKLQSSAPKHFFCAETDEERDDWVTALIEFTETEVESEENSPVVNYSDQFLTPSSRYDTNDELDSISRTFMYDQTPAVNDQVSTRTSNSQEMEQQSKKMKKRSFFAFKREAVNEEQSMPQQQPDPRQMQSLPQSQDSMQMYFDQLNLDSNLAKSVFGRNIEVAYELSNHEYLGKQIPSICYRCLDFLNKTGAVFEEGIFRLSGSASLIRQLKDQFNVEHDIDLFKCALKPDIHTVSGLFKTYLRELPSPIIGASAYNHLSSVASNSSLSPSAKAHHFKDYFNNPSNVDKIHYDVSFIIFKFLRQIISQNQINRMNLRNVCIVFVPTLNVSVDVLTTFLVDFECVFENGKPISDSNREVLDLHIPNF